MRRVCDLVALLEFVSSVSRGVKSCVDARGSRLPVLVLPSSWVPFSDRDGSILHNIFQRDARLVDARHVWRSP